MSTPKLLVIGLDAVEAPMLDDLMAAGRLPALTALRDRGVTSRVEASCMSSLPGAIWQDILTGTSAWRHGDYYPSRVHSGEAAAREIDPTTHAGTYYFDHAAAGGRRCIVVDQPLVAVYPPPAELTLVAEWHVHDAIWARGTHPPSLLDELEERFGRRPYDRCDTNHTDAPESLRAFTDMLRDELSIKVDMAEHLMCTRPWDLMAIAISEGHCAGHQLWHHHDQLRRRGAEGADGADGATGATSANSAPPADHVAEVYGAIDTAIGRLVRAAGQDCAVVVFTSHGMENYVGGPQLLPPLLEAWGCHRPPSARSLLRRLVPKALLGRFLRAAPWLMRAAARRGVWADQLTGDTIAVAVPNNRVGAIRLNLAGREPHGAVTDAAEALDGLERRLLALRHGRTGEPVVERTIRTADTYGPRRHPDLPDLLVVFRRDLGELTEVRCPEAGTVHVPIRRPFYQRTGDHTDQSRLWIDHPRVSALGAVRSEDVAPTLLALLDVPIPDGLDGRVAVTLEPLEPVALR